MKFIVKCLQLSKAYLLQYLLKGQTQAGFVNCIWSLYLLNFFAEYNPPAFTAYSHTAFWSSLDQLSYKLSHILNLSDYSHSYILIQYFLKEYCICDTLLNM